MSEDTLGNQAGKPDFTAWGVAKGVSLLDEEGLLSKLVGDETAKKMSKLTNWFVNEVDTGHSIQPVLQNPDMPRAQKFQMYEQLVCEGMHVSYGARKAFVEQQVRKALAQGAQQVVILGGGFDTLAMRLHKEFGQAQFFELDHASTQRAKLRVLQGHASDPDAQVGANMHFVEADFSNDRGVKENLLEQTDEAGAPLFKKAVPTVFVAEGVLMYLTTEQAERVLADMQDVTQGNATAVFSVTNPASIYSEGLQEALTEGGASEKSSWSDAYVQDILARHGFGQGERHSYHQLTGSRLGELLGRPPTLVDSGNATLEPKELLGEDYYVAQSTFKFRGTTDPADIYSQPAGWVR